MKSAVVYFTRDGSTKIAAEYLAGKTGSDLIQLEPAGKLRNFIRCGYLSFKKKRVDLAGNPWQDTAGSEALILAAPVWAGNGNPVMNSFIDKADFTGKLVYLLTLQADPEKNSREKVLPFLEEQIKARGGTVAGSLAIMGTRPGKTSTEEHIIVQLKDWKV